MFAKTCWDPGRNRYACRERGDYLNPKSHTILARLEGLDDAQIGRLRLAHLAAGPRPARQGGDAALRHAGAARGALSQRRLDQRRDRRPAGGGDGRPRHRPLHRRHGRQLRLRRGQPGRAGALLARPHHRLRRRLQQRAARRLSGAHRRLEDDRRPEVHRGERALAGPGLPPLALLPPAAGRAADRRRGPAPGRHVRRLRLLGRGDDVRPVPASTRATSGCPTRPTCRRSPPSPRPSAAARARATTTCPRPITSTSSIPELKGGLVLKKCDAERARKIDLLFLSVGGNDIGFARLVANAVLADKSILRRLGGWFGHVHGFAEAGTQLDVLDDRLKSVNRALHNLLHVPWSESDRVDPDRLSADGAARRRQDRLPGRPGRHDGAAGVRPERGQGARGQRGGRAAQRHHAESARQHQWSFAEAHRATFRGRGLCAGYSDAPWTMADELRIPRKVNGAWEPFNPSRMARLRAAPAPVPHAQRRLHDRQLPCRRVADAEGAQDAGLRLGAAAAGQRLLGRLPPLRRGPGGDRRRRRGAGAPRARQVREPRARRQARRSRLRRRATPAEAGRHIVRCAARRANPC